jgi:hypothetical protein
MAGTLIRVRVRIRDSWNCHPRRSVLSQISPLVLSFSRRCLPFAWSPFCRGPCSSTALHNPHLIGRGPLTTFLRLTDWSSPGRSEPAKRNLSNVSFPLTHYNWSARSQPWRNVGFASPLCILDLHGTVPRSRRRTNSHLQATQVALNYKA